MKISMVSRSFLALALIASFGMSPLSAMKRSFVSEFNGLRYFETSDGGQTFTYGEGHGAITDFSVKSPRAISSAMIGYQASRVADLDTRLAAVEETVDRHEGTLRRITRWIRGHTVMVIALVVGTVVVGYFVYNALTGHAEAISNIEAIIHSGPIDRFTGWVASFFE